MKLSVRGHKGILGNDMASGMESSFGVTMMVWPSEKEATGKITLIVGSSLFLSGSNFGKPGAVAGRGV